MKLSDVMSAMGFSAFPIAAMILFLAVFVGVLVSVLKRSRLKDLERAALLPLDDQDQPTKKECRP